MREDVGTLGARIREIRHWVGMTQEEFASELGVGTIQVSRWERDVQVPSLAKLAHIAVIGRLSLSRLFDGIAA